MKRHRKGEMGRKKEERKQGRDGRKEGRGKEKENALEHTSLVKPQDIK